MKEPLSKTSIVLWGRSTGHTATERSSARPALCARAATRSAKLPPSEKPAIVNRRSDTRCWMLWTAPVDTKYVPTYFDGVLQLGPATMIATSTTSGRIVFAKKLERGHWHAKLALSPMTDGDER